MSGINLGRLGRHIGDMRMREFKAKENWIQEDFATLQLLKQNSISCMICSEEFDDHTSVFGPNPVRNKHCPVTEDPTAMHWSARACIMKFACSVNSGLTGPLPRYPMCRAPFAAVDRESHYYSSQLSSRMLLRG
mgnify:CR=1 FL=1